MMKRLIAIALLAAAPVSAQAPTTTYPAEWSEPIAPFHIAGPVWYVGTKGMGVYAIKTKAGAILVSAGMAKDAPLIEKSLREIGVAGGDLKLMLNYHAHYDHAGFAPLRADTGALLLSSAADADALRKGRHEADNIYGNTPFPAVPVDRIVKDGETVRLGGVVVTATLTPGHTPGCTTWSLPVTEGGRTLTVVFPCSITVAGNILVSNKAYPGIVADYRKSFDRLGKMKADIVLPMHPEFNDVLGREARAAAGDKDAFVDREALPKIVVQARADFATELAKQQAR